jgi:hypothetical protein
MESRSYTMGQYICKEKHAQEFVFIVIKGVLERS